MNPIKNYAIYRHQKCGHVTDRQTGALLYNNWKHLQLLIDELDRKLVKAEPNWDPKLSKNNVWLYDAVPRGMSAENVAEHIFDLVTEKGGQKIRKNACLLVENIAGFSPDMEGTIDLAQWARDTRDWAKKKHGDNLLGVVLHMDEKTPHIHIIWLPLVQGKDGKKRLNARALLGGPLGPSKVADEITDYAKAMAHHGLRRGTPTTETGVVHAPLKMLRAEQRDKLQNATALKEVLRQPFDKLLGKEASIANLIDMVCADADSEILNEQERKRAAAFLKKKQQELDEKDEAARNLIELNQTLQQEVAWLRAQLNGGGNGAPPIDSSKLPVQRPQLGINM